VAPFTLNPDAWSRGFQAYWSKGVDIWIQDT